MSFSLDPVSVAAAKLISIPFAGCTTMDILVLAFLFFPSVLVSAIVDLPNPGAIYDDLAYKIKLVKPDFVVSIIAEMHDGNYRPICGGSIISQDYVITSADCLSRKSMWTGNRLIAGSEVFKVGGSLHLIKEKVIHESYETSSSFNIALVKVTPPFELEPDSKVNKILLNADKLLVASPLLFMGWGATEKRGDAGYNYPDRLQVALFDVISNNICNKYRLNVDNKQMCAQGYVGKGACHRDTGGPLVLLPDTVFNQENAELVGIATEHSSCGNGLPDVYTKVSEFLPWINKTCGCIVSF